MPNFTESKTDRVYEGFDENDVHFVWRLNEIGSPVSSGSRGRPKRYNRIWRESSGGKESAMETNQSNIISSTTRGSIIHMRPSTCRIISPACIRNLSNLSRD